MYSPRAADNFYQLWWFCDENVTWAHFLLFSIAYMYATLRLPDFRNLAYSLHNSLCLQLKNCFDKYGYYIEIHFLTLI